MSPPQLTIGVLALQGAFIEHIALLEQVGSTLRSQVILKNITVRTAAELELCDGLIIPGGESTTMALVARRTGLMEPLREFAKQKSCWGTCAGMIMLADEVVGGQKQGGQENIGGLGIRIVRNQWGRQVESFDHPLDVQDLLSDPERPFPGVFIRAPVTHSIIPSSSSPLQILATVPLEILPPLPKKAGVKEGEETGFGPDAHVVAVAQGNLMATSFHPELTSDHRFHELFVKRCLAALAAKA